jgi:cytochrome c biogenesis protein CcdA
MTQVSLFKSWIITNLFGSVFIVLIVLFVNLILGQIILDSRRIIQVIIGIILFFFGGILFTLPHFLYSQVIIRKNNDLKTCWRKIKLTLLLPYMLLIIITVAINRVVYGNPIDELPNLLFAGTLLTHYAIGIIVWRQILKKNSTQSMPNE